jgi:proline dehydrogenase
MEAPGIESLKSRAASLWDPLARRAGRAYSAGPAVHDALRICRALSAARTGTIVCFWNDEDDTPRAVADRSIAALEACAREIGDFYLSIKAPALGYDHDLVAEIAQSAAARGVRLHFDAQRPETVERTRRLAERAMAGPALVGYTLPGRFLRSTADAVWAVSRGIAVRVVKGQVPDPAAPELDARRGVLAVIDTLAGRAAHVGVASHDAPLVREALSTLVAAGTPCELELLLGLPMEPALGVARKIGVPVRVYVPFGSSRLPYHLSDARRNPRVLSWLVRDVGRSLALDLERLARA